MSKLAKLTEHARAHLEPGEMVQAAVLGTYETQIMGSDTVRAGILIATDRRVVFYAKKLTGYELESFPYGNISSFEQGKNLLGHNITLFASGNRVHIKWIPTDADLAQLTQYVKAAMNTRHIQTAPTAVSVAAPAPQVDVMGQLRQLGELRDAGILTDAEFEAKKAELLARL